MRLRIIVPTLAALIAGAPLSAQDVGKEQQLDTGAPQVQMQQDQNAVLNIRELERVAEEQDAVIIDLRGTEQFDQRHVDGALNYDEVQGNLEEEIDSKDKAVILYGDEQRLQQVSQELEDLGYTDVQSYKLEDQELQTFRRHDQEQQQQFAMEGEQQQVGAQQIDDQELQRVLRDENAVVLDVRGSEEFQEKHLPGAKNWEDVQGNLDQELQDKNQTVIVFGGQDDAEQIDMVVQRLEEQGYQNVRTFDEGIDNVDLQMQEGQDDLGMQQQEDVDQAAQAELAEDDPFIPRDGAMYNEANEEEAKPNVKGMVIEERAEGLGPEFDEDVAATAGPEPQQTEQESGDIGADLEQETEQFGDELEQETEQFGQQAEQAGEELEFQTEQAGAEVEQDLQQAEAEIQQETDQAQAELRDESSGEGGDIVIESDTDASATDEKYDRQARAGQEHSEDSWSEQRERDLEQRELRVQQRERELGIDSSDQAFIPRDGAMMNEANEEEAKPNVKGMVIEDRAEGLGPAADDDVAAQAGPQQREKGRIAEQRREREAKLQAEGEQDLDYDVEAGQTEDEQHAALEGEGVDLRADEVDIRADEVRIEERQD